MPVYPDFRSRFDAVSATAAYFPSDEDEASSTKYYGLVTRTGAWIILKDTTTAGSIRYASGKSRYAQNWTNRADLTYKYFFELP